MKRSEAEIPVQRLDVASLLGHVKKSEYLYSSDHPLSEIEEVHKARWEEIGAYFGVSGERVCRYWSGAVVRYKFVLKKIIAGYLIGAEMKAEFIGPWFDLVGELVGVKFEEIEALVRKDESLDQNFGRMFRLH